MTGNGTRLTHAHLIIFISSILMCDVSVIFHTGQSPYLIFTNRHEIRRLSLVRKGYTQVALTLKNAVALDVEVTTNKIYWCDLFHRKIFRYTMHRIQ